MNIQKFHEAFEQMRLKNLGKSLERRELGIIASHYGIYFNSTMWASGLSRFFIVTKLGPKFIYRFKSKETSINEVANFMNDCREYARNDQRKILHAKAILRRYGINVEQS